MTMQEEAKQVMKKQHPPFCVQMELTEGCNLMCNFCGVNGIRAKAGDFKCMTVELASLIAQQIRDAGWSVRIEFAMHGEPTFNKDAEKIIASVHKILPDTQLMMLTNGAKLTVDRIRALFEAGLKIIGVDNYGHNARSKILLAEILKDPGSIASYLHHYPDEPEFSPHHRWTQGMSNGIVFISDIVTEKGGSHSNLSTHCGCGMVPPRQSLQTRCALPFRELAIRWDGNVALCCNDYRGVYKIGNVNNASVQELWDSERMQAARRILFAHNRGIIPCKWCTHLSFRNGFLPDKMGKFTMEPAVPENFAIAEEAVRGDSFSVPVLRSWEKCIVKPCVGYVQVT